MMNQRSQGAFYYYYYFKTFKTQNFTIKLSNHLLKVNQIKQLPVGTILSFLLLRQNRTLAVLLIIYDEVEAHSWSQRLSLELKVH